MLPEQPAAQDPPIISEVPGMDAPSPDLKAVPDLIDQVPGVTGEPAPAASAEATQPIIDQVPGAEATPATEVAEPEPVTDSVPTGDAPVAAPEAPAEQAAVIDSVPGMEASTAVEPSREPVPVSADDNATLARKAAQAEGLPVIGPNGPEQPATMVDPGQIESPQQ